MAFGKQGAVDRNGKGGGWDPSTKPGSTGATDRSIVTHSKSPDTSRYKVKQKPSVATGGSAGKGSYSKPNKQGLPAGKQGLG